MILRFQLIYETTWKALSALLGHEGIEAKTPRRAFKAAYQQGWLQNEERWLDMIDDRNLIVHIYAEQPQGPSMNMLKHMPQKYAASMVLWKNSFRIL